MTQPTEQDRHEFDPTPAADYGTLLVQFKGLLRLYNSGEAARSEMSKTIMDLRKRLVDGANDSVNSQRAANARLTDEVERLQARVAELEAICESVPEGCTGKALAKLKADAVRDAILALSAECDFKSGAIASVTGSGYWKTFSDWLEQKANQIEREGGV